MAAITPDTSTTSAAIEEKRKLQRISNPLWLGGTLSVTAIAAIKSLWFNIVLLVE